MKMGFDEYLEHYGMPRRSGRYPWGSGENPYQRNQNLLNTVSELKRQGMTEAEIARGFDMTTTQLRALKSIAKNENRQADISQAQRLKDRGWSTSAIANRMNRNESSIRALLAPGAKDRANILQTTTNMLKDELNKKDYIDVGRDVERHIGVSRTRLKTAIAALKEEGYKVHYVKVPQPGTGKFTTMTVLSKPDVSYSEIMKNRDKIRQIKQIEKYSEDGGRSYLGLEPPKSIDSKRIKVNYAEDGGAQADGTIYVRPGVDDLSLGKSRYAQVRIAVDDTHFLKGMAVYKKDMPAGVDLVFNTNKSRSDVANDKEAMKPMKTDRSGNVDQDNPFGASIKRQLGVMNIVNEEGDWAEWNRSLSSQVLSKQNRKLAKQQLDMTFESKRDDLNEILSLTNPTVRQKLLMTFADDADASSAHLKAAALPRQGSYVLTPSNSLKQTEVYAPNFRDGERVVLIRHPHGGIFEIPELTVNNRNRESKSMLGNSRDAIAINSKVAERLSGADFDGDAVLVIPNNQGRIKTAPMLEGLKNFDPLSAYPPYDGMKPMSASVKQQQMGDVSNLITDMTIRGASGNEIARAVKHSMVVIDAEKHELDWKRSQRENGIPQLKEKYQGGKRAGASTLISRAGSEIRVPERKPRPASQGGPIDKATGKRVFVETGRTYVDKKGNVKPSIVKSKKALETDDLHTLSSGTPMEKIYADHGNKLKDLANKARKEAVHTKNIPVSRSAKGVYAEEVSSLNSKLNIARMNSPRERQALLITDEVVRAKRRANPDMDHDEIKKVTRQALEEARTRTGAKKDRVQITEKEWEAIQAGAIAPSKLKDILDNTDLDQVKQLATPKTRPTMTNAKMARARSMANLGYTQSEIADALGVSVSTISDVISEGN